MPRGWDWMMGGGGRGDKTKTRVSHKGKEDEWINWRQRFVYCMMTVYCIGFNCMRSRQMRVRDIQWGYGVLKF